MNDPLSGERAIDFNIEAIEEIQVLTGALTAEYGSQGGVGVVSTRSGGNEFEGSFKLFYQSGSLDGDGANNHDITGREFEPSSFRTLRPFLTFGGALRKDRLWYFAALEYIDEQEPQLFLETTLNSSREGQRDFAKLTWQVNPEHKAALELYYEPTDTTGNNIGPTVAGESDALYDSDSRLATLRETAVLSPTVVLDSSLSLYQLDSELYPLTEPMSSIEDDIADYSSPTPDTQMLDFLARNPISLSPISEHYRFAPVSGFVRGPYWIDQSTRMDQWSLREDLSFYIDDLLGSHSLKAGLEWQQQEYDEVAELRPLVTSQIARGGLEIVHFTASVPGGSVPLQAERANLALYVQDSWKPLPNLTINLGARVDREVIGSQGRSGFDPGTEVEEYNRMALLYLADLEPYGTEKDATSQIAQGSALNFTINPATDTFACDLDGDGACNGYLPNGSVPTPGVPSNSDLALLRRAFTRHFLDCGLVGTWDAEPSLYTSSGRYCQGTGSAGRLREGSDLQPEEISLGNTNAAPRLSVSYDPLADGKTKLYGTWGRFYGWLFLGTVVSEERAEQQSYSFILPPNSRLLRNPAEGGFSIYQVSRDLRTPYTDEWTLGFERELAPELAMKLVYTSRRGRQQLQDIDVNHVPVDRIGGEGNTPDGRFDDKPEIVDRPGFGGLSFDPDGMPDLEALNPNFNRVYRIGNYNQSSYRSLELVLTRRLRRNWQFETSYTWSEAEGSAEEFQSALGDDPSLAEEEEGYLEYDQRHVVKFFATAHLPRQFNIGGTIQYESGLPYSVVRRDSDTDNYGNLLLRTYYPTEERNDQRNSGYWTFSFSLKKGIAVAGRGRALLSFDAFDLLNTDDLRIYELNRSSRAGLQISDPANPAERQFGRRYQIGVELHF